MTTVREISSSDNCSVSEESTKFEGITDVACSQTVSELHIFGNSSILDVLHSLIYFQIVSLSVFNSNFAVFSSLLPTLIFAGPSEGSFVLLKSFLIFQNHGL